MNQDLEKAKNLLAEGNYTCVLCKGETIHTSYSRGVKPLLDLLTEKEDLQGFSAADKVVGKAAALLYALLGVSEVYAGIVSEVALIAFATHQITVFYDTLVPAIRNRTNTGFCPMEESVWYCDNPEEAVELIQAKLAALQGK